MQKWVWGFEPPPPIEWLDIWRRLCMFLKLWLFIFVIWIYYVGQTSRRRLSVDDAYYTVFCAIWHHNMTNFRNPSAVLSHGQPAGCIWPPPLQNSAFALDATGRPSSTVSELFQISIQHSSSSENCSHKRCCQSRAVHSRTVEHAPRALTSR